MNERRAALEAMIVEDPEDPFLQYALALEVARTHAREGLDRLEALTFQWPDYLPSYYQLASMNIEIGEEGVARGWARKGLTLANRVGDRLTARELTGLLASIDEDED